jgi:hypothetical protein
MTRQFQKSSGTPVGSGDKFTVWKTKGQKKTTSVGICCITRLVYSFLVVYSPETQSIRPFTKEDDIRNLYEIRLLAITYRKSTEIQISPKILLIAEYFVTSLQRFDVFDNF